ncbi:hypothetical protein VB620_14890 [Nodularia harveyana UHCC-0300]|uniref:Uncharacterized protein n=1 Tax=Nodularia harveyana UHCC-0300 TaxID=2974287 RepID=A0ABU5UHC1_9CYAN|nr:hypothetical protein [Nodularia harveyana]MEA5582624.1 hypothetical protein [Nodularia harveyana UHCC-0300]
MQTTPNSETHPSSVPLYVYRELATELQSTQAKLNALTQQNQQLEQQNQLLRREITQVIQSFSHLQTFVDSHPQPSPPQPNPPQTPDKVKNPAKPSSPPQQTSRQRQPSIVDETNHYSNFSAPVEINDSTPETFFIEEQEVMYYPQSEKKVKEFSGWWLAAIIVLIMLSAFGAGYFIVRPLLENQNP